MPLRQFIRTVYELVIHGRWEELNKYLTILSRLGEQISVELRAGEPQDIEGEKP